MGLLIKHGGIAAWMTKYEQNLSFQFETFKIHGLCKSVESVRIIWQLQIPISMSEKKWAYNGQEI